VVAGKVLPGTFAMDVRASATESHASPAPPVTYGRTTGSGMTATFALALADMMPSPPPLTEIWSTASPKMSAWEPRNRSSSSEYFR
jgi:hypothetical protein